MIRKPKLAKPPNDHLAPDQSRLPGGGTKLALMLSAVRTKPGQRTSSYAVQCGVSQSHARQLLLQLLRRKLVGRQEGMGLGNYESTWTPEVYEETT